MSGVSAQKYIHTPRFIRHEHCQELSKQLLLFCNAVEAAMEEYHEKEWIVPILRTVIAVFKHRHFFSTHRRSQDVKIRCHLSFFNSVFGWENTTSLSKAKMSASFKTGFSKVRVSLLPLLPLSHYQVRLKITFQVDRMQKTTTMVSK